MPNWSIGWRAYASAALLGLLAAGALPPLTLVPLLFVAIPGLLLLIGAAPGWRSAAARGLVFGLFHHMAGLYWITNAILVMAAEFWWAVPIAVPLLALVLATFIAIPCGLARLAPAGWPRLLVLAGSWVLGDIARQFVLSGFPWNLLATAWEMPGALGVIFIQPAAWVGAHGLTLMTLLLTGSLALGPAARRAALACLLLWAVAGYARLQRVAPLTGRMAVIVQGNVSEADHRDHGDDPAWVAQVFDRALALTRKGVAEAGLGPKIVVWPETGSPYALAQDTAARRALADAAGPGVMSLAGAERFESRTVAHNSLVAVTPDGGVADVYDKAHLVPYGEYFPSYAHFMLGEQGFTPGPGIRTLHLPGLPAIGPLICYEAIFPSQVVDESDRPALLVNITNDAWFGDSAGPRQHLAAARLRTVEEGLPMVRAANTGISAVIDAHGRITAHLGLGDRGVLVAAIPGNLSPTLVSRLGLADPLTLSLLCCCLGAWGGFRRRPYVE
jgi:apolipoprotein N-acyltransferase